MYWRILHPSSFSGICLPEVGHSTSGLPSGMLDGSGQGWYHSMSADSLLKLHLS